MEYDEVMPYLTAGSIGSGVTLGVLHKFAVAPNEVVKLHQVGYWTEAIGGGNGQDASWALSFDAAHESPSVDLNALITDVMFRENQKVWLRSSVFTFLTTEGGGVWQFPIIIPMHGYTIGRSVICLFFNESGGSRYVRTSFWWEPVKVGVTVANSMHMRRSVME